MKKVLALAPALYIHVPFCIQKCFYCDFASRPISAPEVESYLAALEQEGRAVLASWPVSWEAPSIYVGGGTPTALRPAELERVLRVAAAFPRARGAEWTVEANPGTVDEAKLKLLLDSGVNRLSFGVQSFDDEELRFLGRIHTARDSVAAWELARRVGFSNLSLDLIYALPGQSLDSWRRTLGQAAALCPEHISAYSLSVEPETEFGRRQAAGTLEPVDDELDLALYQEAQEVLSKAGLLQYEISNFARPGYESRHNLVYWRNEPYWGLGPAATSYIGGERRTNLKKVADYCRELEVGRAPVAERELAGRELEMAETVILGLRLVQGITWERFYERFGVDLRNVYPEVIKRLAAAGLIVSDKRGLRLTPRGLAVANRVFLEFLPD
ncbi:MAG: radical SAM family heme chaperone HemW [Firmicutes bacterium]|jgi:oxygen-independent coproporphyrinogen-3 oxidase|nr:radical SAM family heme chaperone HemW [Bacillota bacterium]